MKVDISLITQEQHVELDQIFANGKTEDLFLTGYNHRVTFQGP